MMFSEFLDKELRDDQTLLFALGDHNSIRLTIKNQTHSLTETVDRSQISSFRGDLVCCSVHDLLKRFNADRNAAVVSTA